MKLSEVSITRPVFANEQAVGHAHPHVVQAIQAQAGTLNVHSRYLHSGILDYAERLLSHHAAPLTSAIFACTGTEANEVALQMASFMSCIVLLTPPRVRPPHGSRSHRNRASLTAASRY